MSLPATAAASSEVVPANVSDRVRHERRLGLRLSAPAFLVMVLVTAYPLGYAVVLSLYNYRLTDPEGREFVGLQNYVTVLGDPVWWSAVATTTITTAVAPASPRARDRYRCCIPMKSNCMFSPSPSGPPKNVFWSS